MSLPKPFYETELGRLYHGDCLDILPYLEPVDLVLTDPPYGLSFMGKAWDRGVPGPHFWKSVVSKPGAHLFAFGGTRTFHRLACAIEDAGWEIRDTVGWLYGSGFPKSLDVSKAIDKAAGENRPVVSIESMPDKRCGNYHGSSEVRQPIDWARTSAASAASAEWQGWGTAFKPAWEPIIIARRPILGTVAENVLAHGAGALNIDRCRVNFNGQEDEAESKNKNRHADFGSGPRENKIFGADNRSRGENGNYNPPGRWPANLIHDGSDEVMDIFPPSSVTGNRVIKNRVQQEAIATPFTRGQDAPEYTDTGSAARFFYTAKASRRDRGKFNTHPTVKPFKLIRYFARMASKRGQLILDPFAGSCTLAVVCEHLNRRWICIEKDEKNCDIGVKRIESERKQLKLF